MGLRTFLGLKKRRGIPVVKVPFPVLADSRAQMHQDSWVVQETSGKRKGFFVEIGAFDGMRLSNTYVLEKNYDWSGILAEPSPTHTIPILSKRSAKLCTRPVDSHSGNTVLMRFMVHDPELSSIDRVAEKDMHAEYRKKDHVEIAMETLSLNDLLSQYDAPRGIDYISIDTEGNEFDILSSFDFDKYKVNLFTIEHNFTDDEARIDALLFSKGYERVFREYTSFDAWYRLKC